MTLSSTSPGWNARNALGTLVRELNLGRIEWDEVRTALQQAGYLDVIASADAGRETLDQIAVILRDPADLSKSAARDYRHRLDSITTLVRETGRAVTRRAAAHHIERSP